MSKKRQGMCKLGLFEEKRRKNGETKMMSMKYDFTTILNREGTGAIAVSKIPFDNAEIKEGFSKIPMWVADMNYATAPSVIEAIQNRLAHRFSAI